MAPVFQRTLLALCLLLSACEERKIPPVIDQHAEKIKALFDEGCDQRSKSFDPDRRAGFQKALATFQKGLALCDKVADADDWNAMAKELASTHISLDENEKAEAVYREILAQNDEQFGKDSPESVYTLDILAHVLCWNQKFAEAEALLRRLVTIREDALGANSLPVDPKGMASHYLSSSLKRLGLFLEDTNRLEEAEPILKRALLVEIDCELNTGIKISSFDTNELCYRSLLLKMGDTEEQAQEKIDKMMEPLSKK